MHFKIKSNIGKASHFLFVNLTSMPVKIGTDSSLFSINFKEDQNQGSFVSSPSQDSLLGPLFFPAAFSEGESYTFSAEHLLPQVFGFVLFCFTTLLSSKK